MQNYTLQQTEQLKQLSKAGLSGRYLCKHFNIHHSTLKRILNDEYHKDDLALGAFLKCFHAAEAEAQIKQQRVIDRIEEIKAEVDNV